jgi:hypothetical protein
LIVTVTRILDQGLEKEIANTVPVRRRWHEAP